MSKLRRLPPETVIADYRAACGRVGIEPGDIRYVRGWFLLNDGGFRFRYRSGQIIHMTATLNERAGLKPKG